MPLAGGIEGTEVGEGTGILEPLTHVKTLVQVFEPVGDIQKFEPLCRHEVVPVKSFAPSVLFIATVLESTVTQAKCDVAVPDASSAALIFAGAGEQEGMASLSSRIVPEVAFAGRLMPVKVRVEPVVEM